MHTRPQPPAVLESCRVTWFIYVTPEGGWVLSRLTTALSFLRVIEYLGSRSFFHAQIEETTFSLPIPLGLNNIVWNL